jgi:hypothetical protein
MNAFCASVNFDAFIALRSNPSQGKMTPKTQTHFEGVSGRQIRNADRKRSNRASIYRNYTCQLLESFAPFVQNSLGSEPPQGCRLRDKQRCMGAIAPTRCAQPTPPPRTTRKEALVMAHAISAATDAVSALRERRRLLRILLGGGLIVSTVAVAGCGTRRELPPERRTRGRYGHRGD